LVCKPARGKRVSPPGRFFIPGISGVLFFPADDIEAANAADQKVPSFSVFIRFLSGGISLFRRVAGDP
jgi:hypothetical protein